MARVAALRSGASSRREGPSVAKLRPATATPSRRKKVPVEREYVGIDLHRRRSVIVRNNADGEVSSIKTHIENDPVSLIKAVAAAGPEPEVVLEATFGWYWATDLLKEMGRMSIWPIRWATIGGSVGSRRRARRQRSGRLVALGSFSARGATNGSTLMFRQGQEWASGAPSPARLHG